MSLPPPRDNYVGAPQYPSPWTTKRPLEGLRDTDAAKIISLSPDVCLTPCGSSVVPIPYPVVDYCGHDESYTPSVRFTSQKAMVLRSNTTHVHGDAPGTKKGVKSRTVEGICEPIGHASQVRAEGSYVIRHLDRFHMNNKNTVGEAIFVRDTKTYQAPEDDDPVPGSATTEPIQLASLGHASQFVPEPTQAADVPSTNPGASTVSRRGTWGEPVELAFSGPLVPRIAPFVEPFVRPMPRPVPVPIPRPAPVPVPRPLPPQPQLGPQMGPRPPVPGPTLDPQLDPNTQPKPEPTPKPDLGPGDDVRIDEKCPVTIICFLPKGSHDREEYRRQLKMQEGKLNQMDVADYQRNRAAFESPVTGPGIRQHAANARSNYRSRLRSNLVRQHGRIAGEIEYQKQIWSNDALHRLDTVAGGDPQDIAKLGGSAENQHIGRSWVGEENPEDAGNSQKRIKKLDDHAKRLQAAGCRKMRALLEVCEMQYTYPEMMA
jgi:hypothetical protein